MNTKPIVIQKAGSKWHLFVDFDVAQSWSSKKLSAERRKFLGHGPIPLVKEPGGGVNLEIGGRPIPLKKSDARHLAFQIGHYMLGLGQFVDTYVEGY
jgi:hypothetical protein